MIVHQCMYVMVVVYIIASILGISQLWFNQVLRSLGNLVAGDTHITNVVLVAGHEITG